MSSCQDSRSSYGDVCSHIRNTNPWIFYYKFKFNYSWQDWQLHIDANWHQSKREMRDKEKLKRQNCPLLLSSPLSLTYTYTFDLRQSHYSLAYLLLHCMTIMNGYMILNCLDTISILDKYQCFYSVNHNNKYELKIWWILKISQNILVMKILSRIFNRSML